ncbi:MAG: hypothetical protein Q4D16_12620 [Eubacteriales bacterium]|nr:hypothetical protein [Eubacteriales bacterium]
MGFVKIKIYLSFRTHRFETLVQLMARYYNTTKLAARKRLVELGYHEAKGIGNYADGKAIPALSCANGVLGRNQTFLIGLNPQNDKNNPIPGIKCCPTQNSQNEKHEHMGKTAKLTVNFVYTFCVVG